MSEALDDFLKTISRMLLRILVILRTKQKPREKCQLIGGDYIGIQLELNSFYYTQRHLAAYLKSYFF